MVVAVVFAVAVVVVAEPAVVVVLFLQVVVVVPVVFFVAASVFAANAVGVALAKLLHLGAQPWPPEGHPGHFHFASAAVVVAVALPFPSFAFSPVLCLSFPLALDHSCLSIVAL